MATSTRTAAPHDDGQETEADESSSGTGTDPRARQALDAATATLLDAERLAANVLARADWEARVMMSQAQDSACQMTCQTRASIEEMFRARHEEVLALLVECRDEIRARARINVGPAGWRFEEEYRGIGAAPERSARRVGDPPIPSDVARTNQPAEPGPGPE